MQPGLARAVPMGILGFVGGALLALVIRLAQGLDPAGSVGPAFVLGAFISAGTFVWGMGAFDPKMNLHGDHAIEEARKPVFTTPTGLLSNFTWQMTFWLILGILAIAVFAFVPGGPHVRNVHPGQGDVASVGFVTLGGIYEPVREFLKTATALDLLPPMADNLAQIEISYLVIFIVFVAIMMLSLFVAGALFAFLVSYFGQGKKNPDAAPIPWRVLVFILGIAAPLLQVPLLVASKEVPMALVVPAFLLPPLLLLIAYRKPIWALLVLICLPLPVLVPNIKVTEIASIMFAIIGVAVVSLVFNLLLHTLSERVWRIAAGLVLSVLVILTFLYTISLTRTDFWQMLFSVLVVALSFLLILPMPYLRLIIPASVREAFGKIDWNNLIPEAAGWLANLLRNGLPGFIGQK
ncbi:MAG: hypothetical protein R3E39_09015 [Anaerolineae bacterium]